MERQNDSKVIYIQILRWIARILSATFATFFLLSVVGEIIEPTGSYTLIGGFVVVFGFLMLGVFVITWFNERLAGTIMLISAVLFVGFIFITAGSHRVLASLVISGGFWVPGILFYHLNDRFRVKRHQ